jgi:hypothetical protein
MSDTIGNLGARVDFKIVKGTDCPIVVNVVENGAAKDLTDYTATLVVKSSAKAASTLLTKTPTITELTGQIATSIADTDTSAVTWETAFYYLNMIDDDGNITRLIDGQLTIVFGTDE